MDPNTRALTMGAAGAAAKTYVEDVFSTWLYTGNGSTQTITNGIDLAGKGGLVWTKKRNLSGFNSFMIDSARNNSSFLIAHTTGGESSAGPTFNVVFNSNGFTDNLSNQFWPGDTLVSWTFRKAAKFFDVVTYTGTGANRTIAHSLGSVPGTVIVKRTDSAADWQVYHRSLANTEYLVLNSTAAKATGATRWNSTTPTSTEFSLGTDTTVNASGGTYVAYLFAHDAGGFGDAGSDNVVSCGSYTGNGSASGPTLTLNWEPQWLLIKRTDSTGDWQLIDNMRGFVVGGTDAELNPNLSNAESTGTFVTPLATGFQLNTTDAGYNASSGTYIYIAIRRGPMKTPTDATKVFSALTATVSTGTVRTTDFPIDLQLISNRPQNALAGHYAFDRLRGISTTSTASGANLNTTSSNAESTSIAITQAFTNTGFTDAAYLSGYPAVWWNFRRAPGFFDVVAYTGGGTSVNHNLKVVPELMFVKVRSTSGRNWVAARPGGIGGFLNTSDGFSAGITFIDLSSATTTTFPINGNPECGQSGQTYIAYLFATLTGISKVGSYTGTGTTLNVDCGFTAGARFVLIKRTDSSGDWYVWDTARGIVSGNDPYLLLNSTAAEVTSTDYIDPLSSGFQISSTAPAAINNNGGSFIFLAIA